jgi:hypothetical protein
MLAMGRHGAVDGKLHRGTPPEDVDTITAGLLARGSLQLSGLPDAKASVTQSDSRSPLTVAGAAPALPLDTAHRVPS